MSRKVYLIKAFSGYEINLKSVAQNVALSRYSIENEFIRN